METYLIIIGHITYMSHFNANTDSKGTMNYFIEIVIQIIVTLGFQPPFIDKIDINV